MRTEYPEFKLFIREGLSETLVAALNRGELDILLLALPFPADNVDVMPLIEDDFLLASPANHPLANKAGLLTLLPKMAVDAGITSGTGLVTQTFDQSQVSREIGLMWRKKTPRQREFRLLGEFIQRCQNT